MTADLQTIDGRPALRLERYLDHPVERVWRAVSHPAEVRRWMPAAADWTLAVGAEFELGGQRGRITELDPPQLIGSTPSWPARTCRKSARTSRSGSGTNATPPASGSTPHPAGPSSRASAFAGPASRTAPRCASSGATTSPSSASGGP